MLYFRTLKRGTVSEMKKVIQFIKEKGDIPTAILMILVALSYLTEDKRYLMYPLLAIFTLICIFVIYVFFFSWISPLFIKEDKNIDTNNNNSIKIPDEILNLSLMKTEESQRDLNMSKEEHLQLLNDFLNDEYRPQVKELERINKEYKKALILPHEEKKRLVVKLGEEKLALSVEEEEQRKKQISEDNNIFYKVSVFKLYSIIIFSIFFIGPISQITK